MSARVLIAKALLAFVLVLGACAAGAPPYAQCGGSIDCAGSSCLELRYTRTDGSEGDGAFCSALCTSDADCLALDGATDAACVTLDQDPPLRFFCAARCTRESDCYAGLACTSTEDATLGDLCLPVME